MMIETEYTALAGLLQGGAINKTVVAIGNFDGVHMGHRVLLAHARKIADESGVRLVVLTFTPHPRAFFRPDQPPFLLTDALQKAEALQQAGADAVVALRFDAALAALSAGEFIDRVLKNALGAQHIVVGENFLFGHGRAGNVASLTDAGLAVSALPAVTDKAGERISSERIRTALRAGDVALASDLLGRDWALRGTVVMGHQRGRTIGFPTANMGLGDYLRPQFGVYTAQIAVEGEYHPAVVNIGQRPTIGISGPLLEAHLLDFAGDLYGKTMQVGLQRFLRPERKFDSFELLREQIGRDVEQARSLRE